MKPRVNRIGNRWRVSVAGNDTAMDFLDWRYAMDFALWLAKFRIA